MSQATIRTHLGSLKDAVEKLDIPQGTLDLMILTILSRASRIDPMVALRQE